MESFDERANAFFAVSDGVSFVAAVLGHIARTVLLLLLSFCVMLISGEGTGLHTSILQ